MCSRSLDPDLAAIMADSYVVAKCVGCGARRNIRPGEIPAGDHPMCSKCFSPMVAESAVAEGVSVNDLTGDDDG